MKFTIAIISAKSDIIRTCGTMHEVVPKNENGDRFRKVVAEEVSEGKTVERWLVVNNTEVVLLDWATQTRAASVFIADIESISMDIDKRKIILNGNSKKFTLLLMNREEIREFSVVLAIFFAPDELIRPEMNCLRQFVKPCAPDWYARFCSAAQSCGITDIPSFVVQELREIANYAKSSLSFGSNPIFGRFYAPILKAIGCFPSLTSIEVLKGVDLGCVVPFLQKNIRVSELCFYGEPPDESMQILDFIQNNISGVTELAWKSAGKMQPELSNKLVELVRANKLEALKFEETMGSDELVHFLDMCGTVHVKSLTVLSVSNLVIDWALPRLCEIESLTLECCGLDISSVFRNLASMGTNKLKHVNLSGNKFSKDNFVVPPGLTSIKLRDVTFSGKSLRTFLKAFLKTIGPISCDVSHAQVHKWKSVLHIFERLKTPSLVAFYWDGNPCSARLFNYIETCTTLSTLSFCGCKETDLVLLENTITKLPNLETLCLKGDPAHKMQGLGVRIISALHRAEKLKALDISGHGIGRDGIHQLASLILQVPSLRQVTCDGTDVFDPLEWDKFLSTIESSRTRPILIKPPTTDLSHIAQAYQYELRFHNLALMGPYEAHGSGKTGAPEEPDTTFDDPPIESRISDNKISTPSPHVPEESTDESVPHEVPKQTEPPVMPHDGTARPFPMLETPPMIGDAPPSEDAEIPPIARVLDADAPEPPALLDDVPASRIRDPPAVADPPPASRMPEPPVLPGDTPQENPDGKPPVEESPPEPKLESAEESSSATFSNSQRESSFARNRSGSTLSLNSFGQFQRKRSDSPQPLTENAHPLEPCCDVQQDEPASSSTQELESLRNDKPLLRQDDSEMQLEDINTINASVLADHLVCFPENLAMRRGRIGGRRLPSHVTVLIPKEKPAQGAPAVPEKPAPKVQANPQNGKSSATEKTQESDGYYTWSSSYTDEITLPKRGSAPAEPPKPSPEKQNLYSSEESEEDAKQKKSSRAKSSSKKKESSPEKESLYSSEESEEDLTPKKSSRAKSSSKKKESSPGRKSEKPPEVPEKKASRKQKAKSPKSPKESIRLKERVVIPRFEGEYSSDSEPDFEPDLDKDRISKAKPINWAQDLPVVRTPGKRKLMTALKKKYSVASLLVALTQSV